MVCDVSGINSPLLNTLTQKCGENHFYHLFHSSNHSFGIDSEPAKEIVLIIKYTQLSLTQVHNRRRCKQSSRILLTFHSKSINTGTKCDDLKTNNSLNYAFISTFPDMDTYLRVYTTMKCVCVCVIVSSVNS